MKLFNLREQELVNKIQKASQSYYSTGTSEYTDEEFDAMIKELRSINPNHPLLTTTGHGYDVQKVNGTKVKHKYGTAGSLGKAYAINEIPSSIYYAPKVQISLKLDGLSIVAYYNNGKLIQALTRGDGETGIDKTDRLSLIIPSKLGDSQFSGAIRGELIFNETNWEKYKEIHPDAKNPRNSAAGMINADNFIPEEFKLLDFVAYTVVGTDWNTPLPVNFATIDTMTEFLTKYIPHVVPFETTEHPSLITPGYLQKLMSQWVAEYKYRADGVVLKNNKIILKDRVDTIEYKYDAIAFKFESEIKETIVTDIEWNLSKTRYLIPTVVVAPIELAGTTVTRATGYNAAYIRDNHIDKGAVVKITKCGEIIPNIKEVVKPANMCQMPLTCPACGEPLVWEGVHLMCKNEFCGNARMQDIIAWCLNIAPIDGFKDSLIARFVTEYFGERAAVEMLMDADSYMSMGGRRHMGSVQSNMFALLILKLNSSDPIDFKSALLALNIPRLGDVTCRKLSDNVDLGKRILADAKENMLSNDIIAELRNIVGDATTDSILSNFHKWLRLKLIADRIVFNEPIEVKGEVVITGKLSMPRNQFETVLAQHGFKVGSAVNKNTFALITDDPNSSSSKNKKASELGIPKISESKFTELYFN